MTGGPREPDATTAAVLRAVEVSPDLVVIIGEDGRFTYVNEGGAHALGWQVGDFIGRPWDTFTHPEDLAAVRWLMTESPPTRAATQTRQRAADGSYHHYLWSSTTLPGDGLYAIGKAVPHGWADAAPTAREVARLEETERLANVGSWERRATTGENHWSEGLRRIVGVDPGHPGDFETGVLPLVHPDDRGDLAAAREHALATGELLDAECRIVRGDGEIRVIHIRATFDIDDDGLVARSLGFIHDVTEQRRIEADLAHARRMEALGRLTGSVAHDFNNFIAGISGFAQLALQDIEDPAVALREIASIAEHAAELTASLLHFRLDAEGDGPDAGDLRHVVLGHAPLLERLVKDSVEVSVSATGAGLVALSDRQLSQVLVNLVVNADDAMPEGGEVRIEAVTDHVAVLTVEDTGVGMPSDVADRAFEPFFTTKPVGQGAGLGLSTVYAMVTQRGGTVHLDSAPGRGTRVRIELPVVEHDAEPAPEPQTPHTPGEGATVLVVEDEPAVRRVVTAALEDAGYDVLAAGDPETALRLSAAHEGDIGLVLTDVVMPAMSGPSLVEALRRDRPDVAVLYMSGYPQPGQWGVGPDQLDAALLRKPFAVTDLVARVAEALRPGLP